jgi:hypothetical protein
MGLTAASHDLEPRPMRPGILAGTASGAGREAMDVIADLLR